jgi:hypothetical protein
MEEQKVQSRGVITMLISKIRPVIIILTLILGASPLFGQGTELDIKNKRVTVQQENRPLWAAFSHSMNTYDIAIGFEESALDRGHNNYFFETNLATTGEWRRIYRERVFPPLQPDFEENLITLDFKNARLEEVMDSIVSQMNNYAWEVSDGVVNIYPTQGRDPRLKKFLETKVERFYMGMGAEITTIKAQIEVFQPEFRQFLKDNGLENEAGNFSAFDRRTLPNGMAFTNLTFKELLNAITREKRGGWILRIKNYRSSPGVDFLEIQT